MWASNVRAQRALTLKKKHGCVSQELTFDAASGLSRDNVALHDGKEQ
jgi:hypothetical protein